MMNAPRFRHLLLDICLAASAVDGDVDALELVVIRNVLTKTLIGDDTVRQRLEQLDSIAASWKEDVDQRRSACLEELRRETLTAGQRRRLLDIFCLVIGADRIFMPEEVKLLREVVAACGLSMAEATALCPEHAAVLRLSASDIDYAVPVHNAVDESSRLHE